MPPQYYIISVKPDGSAEEIADPDFSTRDGTFETSQKGDVVHFDLGYEDGLKKDAVLSSGNLTVAMTQVARPEIPAKTANGFTTKLWTIAPCQRNGVSLLSFRSQHRADCQIWETIRDGKRLGRASRAYARRRVRRGRCQPTPTLPKTYAVSRCKLSGV
jgi:hypothetical protein